jgi:hypothetical protein
MGRSGKRDEGTGRGVAGERRVGGMGHRLMETGQRGGGMQPMRACHCVLVSRVGGGGSPRSPDDRGRVAGSGTPRPLVVAQCARAVSRGAGGMGTLLERDTHTHTHTHSLLHKGGSRALRANSARY